MRRSPCLTPLTLMLMGNYSLWEALHDFDLHKLPSPLADEVESKGLTLPCLADERLSVALCILILYLSPFH